MRVEVDLPRPPSGGAERISLVNFLKTSLAVLSLMSVMTLMLLTPMK